MDRNALTSKTEEEWEHWIKDNTGLLFKYRKSTGSYSWCDSRSFFSLYRLYNSPGEYYIQLSDGMFSVMFISIKDYKIEETKFISWYRNFLLDSIIDDK